MVVTLALLQVEPDVCLSYDYCVAATFRSIFNDVKQLRENDPATLDKILWPPEKAFESGKDADLFPFIKSVPSVTDHYAGAELCCMDCLKSRTGTTKMGRVGDAGTVVDGFLHVVGVSGLMVADNAISPQARTSRGCVF